jgi:Rieske Fe-S protein
MNTNRREFIKSSCNACLLAATGALFSELAACSPAARVLKVPVSNNSVQVPLTAFTTGPLVIVRPSGWLYDIAVRKIADGQYDALLLQCTHQQNQLVVNSNGYQCNLHGSQFDQNGKVVKGPAALPLKRFDTTLNSGELIIHFKT